MTRLTRTDRACMLASYALTALLGWIAWDPRGFAELIIGLLP